MRFFLTLLLATVLGFAATVVKPDRTIDVEGNVVDMIVQGDTLYAATDAGKLEIYDWKNRKQIDAIAFETIHDFMGDPMRPKVFSVDVLRCPHCHSRMVVLATMNDPSVAQTLSL